MTRPQAVRTVLLILTILVAAYVVAGCSANIDRFDPQPQMCRDIGVRC